MVWKCSVVDQNFFPLVNQQKADTYVALKTAFRCLNFAGFENFYLREEVLKSAFIDIFFILWFFTNVVINILISSLSFFSNKILKNPWPLVRTSTGSFTGT